EAFTAKGTPGGMALHDRPRFCAIVSSILSNLIHGADVSRFTVLELGVPPDDGGAQFERLKNYIQKIDDGFSLRMFSRTFLKIDVLKACIDKFWDALRAQHTPRVAQQYSALIAGWFFLTHNAPPDDDYAKEIVAGFQLDEVRRNSGDNDHDDCLDHLLRVKISYKIASDFSEASIAKLARDVLTGDNDQGRHVLPLYGIKISRKTGELAISNKHPELKKLFKGTIWSSGNWSKSLSRTDDAVEKVVKIDGKSSRSIVINARNIFGGQDELDLDET
ncbi:MAG: hypothetical protein IIB06_01210, partial [Bacteroidetes bacterium]|nr:hypothetical protein [Bacteroidota bacterium]